MCMEDMALGLRLQMKKCLRNASYIYVLFKTVRGYTSTLICFMEGKWPPSLQPTIFPLKLWPRDLQHFKTKIV